MSLESGRRLGKIASLINISIPLLIFSIYITYFFSIFLNITQTTPLTASAIPIALTIVLGILGIVAIAGFILFIIAMYKLSHYYQEPKIFTNILYALIISIVGGVTTIIIVIGSMFTFISPLIGQPTPTSTPTFFFQFMLFLAIIVAIALVLGIINGLLYMRAFNKLAEKSGSDSFKTAGILYLIGSIISIVTWMAWIFAYIGFNKLKPIPTYTYTTQPTKQSSELTKRCPNCGTENTQNSFFCRNCGKPL